MFEGVGADGVVERFRAEGQIAGIDGEDRPIGAHGASEETLVGTFGLRVPIDDDIGPPMRLIATSHIQDQIIRPDGDPEPAVGICPQRSNQRHPRSRGSNGWWGP